MVVSGLRLNYWVVEAPPAQSDSSLLPIIMVHGGPGWSHDYMEPLKQQACRGRKVVFYDQVSSHPTCNRPMTVS
jgi:pimeloyl-ACP methyl ester carboxylesterase